MRALILFLLIESAGFQSFAKDKKYPVSDIPENLKQGMYAVIREQQTRFEIKAINKSSHYVHYAITILNEKGKRYASEVVVYDKNRKIVTFKGTAYDAEGSVIKKLKQSEIYDQSSISGFSLYEDNRLKSANLSQTTYPYTVEYEYEIQMDYLYSIPKFFLYEDDEVSAQNISYSVIYAKQISPRFKLTHVNEPYKTINDGKESVTWTFENVVPSKFESYGPELTKVVPNILAGPSDFEYDGYAGKMSSWEEYGKWQGSLLINKGSLPEATKQKVRDLTGSLSTIEAKARVLYEIGRAHV